MKKLSILLALSTSFSAWGANFYVRTGAVGDGSGTDWFNAATQIPATMVRGTIYWMADGTYVARSIHIPPSGTNEIYIKKATIAEHGTSTGWTNTFGDGVATFNGAWTSDSGDGGYITWDGSYEYGFVFNYVYSPPSISSIFRERADDASFNNLRWFYCKAVGPGHEIWGYNWQAKCHFVWAQNGLGVQNNWHIKNCYFSGFVTPIIGADMDNFILENTFIGWATSSNPQFHENLMLLWELDNFICRNNFFYMWRVEGISIADGGSTNGSNNQIYNNLFITRNDAGDCKGIQAYQNTSFRDWKIYNNTFVGNKTTIVIDSPVTRFDIRNNIYHDCLSVGSGVYWNTAGHGTNYYSGYTPYQAESGGINASGVNPFVNSAAGDYRILGTVNATMPRNKGANFSGIFTNDYAYNVRGSDGGWDIGAYEYVDATPVAPTITSDPVNTAVQEGQTATFHVSASGTMPLTYQWNWFGTNVAAATSTSWTTPVLTASEDGSSVNVGVTNSVGGVASATVTLTVNPPTEAIAISTSNLLFSPLATNTSSDMTLYVTNSGLGGTLSGSATVDPPCSIVSGGSYSLAPGVSQAVVVRFTPTTRTNYQGIITFTGGDSATCTTYGIGYFVCVTNYIEPQLATFVSPVTNSVEGYAYTPIGYVGAAYIGFYIPALSTVTLAAQVIATNTANNSFYINIDGGELLDEISTWDVITLTGGSPEGRMVSWRGETGNFAAPQYAPKSWTLAAGNHYIYIGGREENTFLYNMAAVVQPVIDKRGRIGKGKANRLNLK